MYWLNEEKKSDMDNILHCLGKQTWCLYSVWAKTHSHQIYIKYLNCSHEVDCHKIPQVLRRKFLFVSVFHAFKETILSAIIKTEI